ncbi:hypothetical protein [Hydrogenophaga sp.]|uniref:hypothetical protein n=1 Tax=Hydrogenophaga sp. TaxID=1904254 RepID=UPI003569DB7E
MELLRFVGMQTGALVGCHIGQNELLDNSTGGGPFDAEVAADEEVRRTPCKQ